MGSARALACCHPAPSPVGVSSFCLSSLSIPSPGRRTVTHIDPQQLAEVQPVTFAVTTRHHPSHFQRHILVGPRCRAAATSFQRPPGLATGPGLSCGILDCAGRAERRRRFRTALTRWKIRTIPTAHLGRAVLPRRCHRSPKLWLVPIRSGSPGGTSR
jgi:hypothetical protein